MMNYLWIDDMRKPPNDSFLWIKSTNEAILTICQATRPDGTHNIGLIDIDHDSGDYNWNGGDYIEVLKWMERNHVNDIPIRLHSMNVVGCNNMREIVRYNNWKEVL